MGKTTTLKYVRMKCPLCGVAACYNPLTTRHKFLIYECPRCGLKWRVEKGWRAIAMQNMANKHKHN
jgi:hypothetical protein